MSDADPITISALSIYGFVLSVSTAIWLVLVIDFIIKIARFIKGV